MELPAGQIHRSCFWSAQSRPIVQAKGGVSFIISLWRVLVLSSTQAWSDGSAYRGSSLPSLHLQAKGSECSFATRRRVSERKSPVKRRNVGARNSSSGPCVLNRLIERKPEFFTTHFRAAAKVTHSWLRGRKEGSSSPSVNNFGWTISAGGPRPQHVARSRWSGAFLSLSTG